MSDKVPHRLDGTSLKLDFLVDSIRKKSQWVRLHASARGKVPILAENVKYGETIGMTDLTYEWKELSRIDGFILNPQQIIGSVAKKNLTKGSLVYQRDVEEPVLVKRGDVVTLIARGRTFRIRTMARAKNAGSNGDSITVENMGSRRLIQATVVGSKTVEVVVTEIGR